MLSYLNGVDYATLTGFSGPDSAPSLQEHGGGAPGNRLRHDLEIGAFVREVIAPFDPPHAISHPCF